LARRTNYKNEKRSKELDKAKKKEAKKERKLNKDKEPLDENGNVLEDMTPAEETENPQEDNL
jgi:hypothetical protein